MAKLEKIVNGDFNEILDRVQNGVLNANLSASLEESCDIRGDHSRCSVRVFERYSVLGSNRVSMNVTLYQEYGGPVRICAITSGGSQAIFFKINTFGEESFLDVLRDIL